MAPSQNRTVMTMTTTDLAALTRAVAARLRIPLLGEDGFVSDEADLNDIEQVIHELAHLQLLGGLQDAYQITDSSEAKNPIDVYTSKLLDAMEPIESGRHEIDAAAITRWVMHARGHDLPVDTIADMLEVQLTGTSVEGFAEAIDAHPCLEAQRGSVTKGNAFRLCGILLSDIGWADRCTTCRGIRTHANTVDLFLRCFPLPTKESP